MLDLTAGAMGTQARASQLEKHHPWEEPTDGMNQFDTTESWSGQIAPQHNDNFVISAAIRYLAKPLQHSMVSRSHDTYVRGEISARFVHLTAILLKLGF
jgi:hypothetical protein